MAATQWQERQALACPNCGTPRDEAMNPDNQFRYEATAYRCFPCQARESASYDWSHDRPEGAKPDFGVYWAVHLDDDD